MSGPTYPRPSHSHFLFPSPSRCSWVYSLLKAKLQGHLILEHCSRLSIWKQVSIAWLRLAPDWVYTMSLLREHEPSPSHCTQLFRVWFIFAWIVRKTCTVSCARSRDYFNFHLCFPTGNSGMYFYYTIDWKVLKNLMIVSLPTKIINPFIIARISKQILNTEWTAICWLNGHCQKFEVYFSVFCWKQILLWNCSQGGSLSIRLY